MRKKIYNIIEPAKSGDKVSLIYDIVMLIAITASIIPLMFVEENPVFRVIEQVTVAFFHYRLFAPMVYCRLSTQ